MITFKSPKTNRILSLKDETNFIVILLIFILIDVMNINNKLDNYEKK